MDGPERHLRALFLNQGVVGREAVLGHGPVETALVLGLIDEPIDATFARMPPWSLPARMLGGRYPGLGPVDLDLHVARWHLVEGLRGRVAIERLLARQPADVIHLQSHVLGFGATRIAHRIPVVLSVDAPVWEWQALGIWRPVRPYSRATMAPALRMERHAFGAAAHVVAWSRWSRDAVLEAAPGTPVTVLHPGLDLERFRPADHRARALPRILFVGGRFEEKGGYDLLEALAGDLGRTVELDLVTPAPVEPRPGVRVHRLVTGDPRLIDLYQQSDLLCLPTRGDATPWVVLEAMACGTPVVATRSGGIPDLLAGGAHGVLVDVPGTVADIRTALLGLLDDPTRRSAFGGAGRAVAERCYDARVQGRALAGILRSAVAGARQAP